ncbi:hypothetical protein [Streptomyces sp. LS1784]|uniref:hypothetical protein n=1 Tax=Streptomyces sp. LS1784 TaxID=2851533 RepID=UPI001CCAE036|nr:hypothetical protein [Streptomyces sp. LS1784]
MAIAADRTPPEPEARSATGERTGPAGRTLRALAAAHTTAVFGQPVFAGVYLSGDYDALTWHATGANAVTSLGYVQLIAALVLWIRLRRAWPLTATLAVVAAETVQYFAGLDGALWLHLPLGVATITATVVLTIALWRTPLPPRRPTRSEDDRA